MEYSAEHRGDHFFITLRDKAHPNSQLLVAPMADPAKTTVRLPWPFWLCDSEAASCSGSLFSVLETSKRHAQGAAPAGGTLHIMRGRSCHHGICASPSSMEPCNPS